tara:strand:- start:420 stop:596 length:177 start_codon:yes stop_codon:yes gene_type:complete
MYEIIKVYMFKRNWLHFKSNIDEDFGSSDDQQGKSQASGGLSLLTLQNYFVKLKLFIF